MQFHDGRELFIPSYTDTRRRRRRFNFGRLLVVNNPTPSYRLSEEGAIQRRSSVWSQYTPPPGRRKNVVLVPMPILVVVPTLLVHVVQFWGLSW